MTLDEVRTEFSRMWNRCDIPPNYLMMNNDPKYHFAMSGCIRGRFIAVLFRGEDIYPNGKGVGDEKRFIEKAGGIYLTCTPGNIKETVAILERLGETRVSGEDR